MAKRSLPAIAVGHRQTWNWQLEEFCRLAAIESDECVLWAGRLGGAGYGVIEWDGVPDYMHRVALAARIPPPGPGMCALHAPLICHDRRCLNYRHLRWGTRGDNFRDALVDGTFSQGEQHPVAKLNEAAVRLIRQSVESPTALARRYGVSGRTIRDVRTRTTWKSMP